jgi:hypothetical protein
MEELRAGSTFAGYRIEHVAGRGGMGVVYCATDPGLDRPVALKVIAPPLAGNAEFRRRFTIESRVAASLDHPNVIPIYQAGEAEGVMFLAMRYVDGHDLRSLVCDGSRLSPERAAGITAQIAAALDAAHEAGLVHRDVKPANVLVTSRDHVYLMDFGLTKRLAVEHDATGSGRLLGTLNYVAPEQIRGEQIGPYTDVYALGGTLFQMLTGRVPFPLDTEEGRLWAHLSEPAPAPSTACEDVPTAFDSVVHRAMSKDPKDRFPSAGELGDAAMAALGATSRAPPAVARSSSFAGSGAARSGPSRRAILRRALLDPFALLLLVAMLAAGALVNFAVVLPIALVLYCASVTRAYLDADVRDAVGGREEKGQAPASPPPEPPDEDLVMPRSRIDEMLDEALEKEAHIRDTVQGAESARSEVGRELDELGGTIRRAAAHARILQAELNDTSASAIERRIAQLERAGEPRHERLVAALKRQLSTRRAMQEQMRVFYDEMSETLSELDSVESELDATSGLETGRLVAEVRDLRQGMRKVDEELVGARDEEVLLEGAPPIEGGPRA